MEVTAFIIELSAEVVKGIQGGNECWMGNNEKLRGEVAEGMGRGERIEIDRSDTIKASKALTIPTVTARNSFRIVKAGLSEYCTASQKIISAVPPPLFRGRAWMPEVERPKFRKDAKPTKRSYKGKGVGARRGIVRIWKGWRCKAIPSVVARIFSGDSTSPLTREASLVRGEG